MEEETVLRVSGLRVGHPAGKKGVAQAVSGVDLHLVAGETLGLVGESGCGKTSLARALIQLPPPGAGSVHFLGENLVGMDKGRLRRIRPWIQMIFQDSMGSLNPRRSVGKTIAMPLRVRGNGSAGQRRQKAREMMAQVGLDPQIHGRRPFEFSGGQCQRIQIARALITAPRLLICDEPVSSLDVSIQAQILHLLEQMRTRYHLAMLFISHDMAVVKTVCDRVAVMYAGKLCETAPVQILFQAPAHPYTAALIGAVPAPRGTLAVPRVRLRGVEPPSPLKPPSGCRFHPRCPLARDRCVKIAPAMEKTGPDRAVACHFPLAGGDGL